MPPSQHTKLPANLSCSGTFNYLFLLGGVRLRGDSDACSVINQLKKLIKIVDRHGVRLAHQSYYVEIKWRMINFVSTLFEHNGYQDTYWLKNNWV
jgi:hypothetical protein